jgi:hypothetical protein
VSFTDAYRFKIFFVQNMPKICFVLLVKRVFKWIEVNDKVPGLIYIIFILWKVQKSDGLNFRNTLGVPTLVLRAKTGQLRQKTKAGMGFMRRTREFNAMDCKINKDTLQEWRTELNGQNFETNNKKVVPVILLTKHHAMKAHWGSEGTAPHIL